MSLQTRFIVYIFLLLLVLLATIILVIEEREVKAIFEEAKNRGILIAQNIAYLNLEPFLYWDEEGVKENLENQTNEKLLYVVFYSRYNQPFVGNDFAEEHEDIFRHSRLPENVTRDTYFYESKRIEDKKTDRLYRVLEIEVPIFTRDSLKRWGSIKIGLSLEDMHLQEQKTRRMLFLIGLGGLFLGMGGAALLARRITNPIKKLVGGTVNIAHGDFSQKIDIYSHDEIGDLARNFNDMSAKLLEAREKMEEAHKRLIQAEKLASIGRVSAGMAHEIRNPLTSVKLNIQKVLQSDSVDRTDMEHLKIAQEGISRMEIIVKDILDYTRTTELNLDRFSIEEILDESIKMIRDSFSQKKIVLEKKYQKNLPSVVVDGEKLRQVFLNILRNAYEAVEIEGKIIVSLSLAKDEGERKVRIVISDSGPGIQEKDMDAIFEPFYTTKTTGTGLGLSIARKIVEQHRGSIEAVPGNGKGASFEVLIPIGGKK